MDDLRRGPGGVLLGYRPHGRGRARVCRNEEATSWRRWAGVSLEDTKPRCRSFRACGFNTGAAYACSGVVTHVPNGYVDSPLVAVVLVSVRDGECHATGLLGGNQE